MKGVVFVPLNAMPLKPPALLMPPPIAWHHTTCHPQHVAAHGMLPMLCMRFAGVTPCQACLPTHLFLLFLCSRPPRSRHRVRCGGGASQWRRQHNADRPGHIPGWRQGRCWEACSGM